MCMLSEDIAQYHILPQVQILQLNNLQNWGLTFQDNEKRVSRSKFNDICLKGNIKGVILI